MKDRIDVALLAKQRLHMRDVAAFYGCKDQKGFICCPFHAEKTASCKIYDDSFYCFGCGAHGDIIDFVSKLFDIPFKDALQKLDADFGLGLYKKPTLKEYRRIQQIQKQRSREEQEIERLTKEYETAYDEYVRLSSNLEEFAPQTPYDEYNPLFIEACHNIAYAEYRLNVTEVLLNERRTNNEYGVG